MKPRVIYLKIYDVVLNNPLFVLKFEFNSLRCTMLVYRVFVGIDLTFIGCEFLYTTPLINHRTCSNLIDWA